MFSPAPPEAAAPMRTDDADDSDRLGDLIGRLASARIHDIPLHFHIPQHMAVHLRLAKNPYRVFCKADLPDHTFLGYVEGDYGYTWEAADPFKNPYLFVVDDDYVIDASAAEVPSVLTFVREGFFIGLEPNVGLITEPTAVYGVFGTPGGAAADDGYPRIGLRTLRPIAEGEELIYTAGKFYET